MSDWGTAAVVLALVVVLHLMQAVDKRRRRTGRAWRDGSPVRERARVR